MTDNQKFDGGKVDLLTLAEQRRRHSKGRANIPIDNAAMSLWSSRKRWIVP